MKYSGTLQTKKDRPYYYIVLSYYVDNKRKQKWISTDIPVKGNNKRKAEAKLKKVQDEYNAMGLNIEAINYKDMLFIDYISQWLENFKLSIAPTTYDSYSNIINKHIIPYFKGSKRLRT